MCLILICGTRAKISRICLFPDLSQESNRTSGKLWCAAGKCGVEVWRIQKLIMFEAVCLFRGRLRVANMAAVSQSATWPHEERYLIRIIMSCPSFHNPKIHFHHWGLSKPWGLVMQAVTMCEIYVSRYLTYFQLGIIIDLNTCRRWIQLWKYMKHLRRIQGGG